MLGVIAVDDIDEALAVANHVRFGLSASLFTRDLERALPDQTRRRQAVEKARHDLQQWALDWEAKTASLRLGDQPTAAQGLAVLRVYREVADEHGRAAELQRRGWVVLEP